MASGQLIEVIQHVRQAMILREGAGLSDGQLLKDYLSQQDEVALAVLVRRHGPMVWGVCRRVLSDFHDAEDAFQATFLVLVRRAASIASPDLLANWLYGVAHQTAMKARATAAKRKDRERQVTDMPEPAFVEGERWDDLQPLLDRELSRLPSIYRVVIVLCDLEGKTRKEAARTTGLPKGTIRSRLARARAALARRLSQRGVVLSGGALAVALARSVSVAAVPSSVVCSTISAAKLVAAGRAAALAGVSARVVALTEGVLKAMKMSKLKTAFVLMVLVSAIGWIGGVVAWQTLAIAQPLVPRGEPELPLAEAVPDVSGTWQGDDWGTVVLRRTKDGGFEGTYSDTFHTDVGRIAVRWSVASRRYEGTWSEGKYRFGRIALEAAKAGDALSGAYTTDPKCGHQPGIPALASLHWMRFKSDTSAQPPGTSEKKSTPQWNEDLWSNEKAKKSDATSRMKFKLAFDPPSREEVLKALPKGQAIPRSPSIECELVSYGLEPPRVYSKVGQAQLSTARFKCTVAIGQDKVVVVYIDKTHLIPTE
jgi:RNA polymerase sigma factor (sigma-70 family)